MNIGTAPGIAALKKKVASGGGGGGFTYTLIAHVSVSADSAGSATSTSIDTTGANLIVYSLSWGKGAFTISDNMSNGSPTGLSVFGDTSGLRKNQLLYLISPTVGAGHTFTISAADGSGYPVLQIAAFKKTGGTPAIDGSGTGVSGDGSNTSSWQIGSQTPSGDNELMIAGLCTTTSGILNIDSSYTFLDQKTTPSAGVMVGGFAYQIQTTATTRNPSFTVSSSTTKEGASHVMFK